MRSENNYSQDMNKATTLQFIEYNPMHNFRSAQPQSNELLSRTNPELESDEPYL
jgi:hypothetical protein